MKKKVRLQKVDEETIRKQPAKIVFGFSKLQPFSYPKADDASFFIKYLERLKKLCNLDWNTIRTTQKHGFGTETIFASSLTQAAQNMLPSNIEKLLVLRATGNNHAFLGIQEDNIFQVFFIEYEFGDIYSHG